LNRAKITVKGNAFDASLHDALRAPLTLIFRGSFGAYRKEDRK
jgi:hypothetical protein